MENSNEIFAWKIKTEKSQRNDNDEVVSNLEDLYGKFTWRICMENSNGKFK